MLGRWQSRWFQRKQFWLGLFHLPQVWYPWYFQNRWIFTNATRCWMLILILLISYYTKQYFWLLLPHSFPQVTWGTWQRKWDQENNWIELENWGSSNSCSECDFRFHWIVWAAPRLLATFEDSTLLNLLIDFLSNFTHYRSF